MEVIQGLGEFEKLGEPVAMTVKEEEEAKPIVNQSISGSGFYGNTIKETHKEPPKLPSHSGPPSSTSHSIISAIEAVSPYAHKWTIKARVTHKSELRTWKRANSEGKLFSVNLLDGTGEIKATAFNEQCDLLFDVFHEGSVYYISSPCKVSLAKKQYSTLSNDYELIFEKETMVEKAEDQESVPMIRYNFINISNLQKIEKDATVDIIAVLKDVGEPTQITSKSTQKPYDKRDLTLVDDSLYSIKLTIWGKLAFNFDSNPDTIIAFKGCKVGDFGGRNLSLLSSGSLTVDPDIPEAHKLRGWYDSEGRRQTFSSHTNLASTGIAGGRNNDTKIIAQVREENLGMSENHDYFSIKATIIYIKQENFAYPACLSEGCNKKLTDMGDGSWRCEKCEISHPRPLYRYILYINVVDYSGQLWLTCFDDVGRLIMGMEADRLTDMWDDKDARSMAFENANCKTFIFKVRAKTENYQDQQRVRYQVFSAAPVNYVQEANKVAECIKAYHIE